MLGFESLRVTPGEFVYTCSRSQAGAWERGRAAAPICIAPKARFNNQPGGNAAGIHAPPNRERGKRDSFQRPLGGMAAKRGALNRACSACSSPLQDPGAMPPGLSESAPLALGAATKREISKLENRPQTAEERG